MTDFSPAGARARGLARHLLTRAELEALPLGEVPALARALARTGKLAPTVGEATAPPELERAVRRTVRGHLTTLARWEGAQPALEVFLADQDRRAIRAFLRGAVQGAPAEERLRGLLPTPGLPERVLAELARQPTPRDVVGHLFALGHPEGARLSPLIGRASQPDLLALERELLHGFARRARAGASRGDDVLREHLALELDLLNAQAALQLVGTREVEPRGLFLEGGRHLRLPDFLGVTTATQQAEVRVRLARAFEGSPLAGLVEAASGRGLDASLLDGAGLRRLLALAARRTREQPLSSAPVLRFLLGLTALSRDVRRLGWGAWLGAPAALLRPELVTP